jgi:glutathione S-transferase
MRVRWALEEVGQRRSSCFVPRNEGTRASCASPFGQIPTYEEGDLTLFKSGSIVFHIAERHGGLLPDDANALVNEVIEAFGQ